jgi:CYTH domain-containing protein
MLPKWQKEKYSLTEREKRFLLATLPKGVGTTCRVIEDLYFQDTRLRLRKVTDQLGQILELKLTQKFPSPNQSGSERNITNLYLTQAEYDLFTALPSHSLRKRRYSYETLNQLYSVDVFEGHLTGLLLAEIEYSFQDPPPSLPPFALEDVTDDLFFTGGHLARLSEQTFLVTFQTYILGSDSNTLG